MSDDHVCCGCDTAAAMKAETKPDRCPTCWSDRRNVLKAPCFLDVASKRDPWHDAPTPAPQGCVFCGKPVDGGHDAHTECVNKTAAGAPGQPCTITEANVGTRPFSELREKMSATAQANVKRRADRLAKKLKPETQAERLRRDGHAAESQAEVSRAVDALADALAEKERILNEIQIRRDTIPAYGRREAEIARVGIAEASREAWKIEAGRANATLKQAREENAALLKRATEAEHDAPAALLKQRDAWQDAALTLRQRLDAAGKKMKCGHPIEVWVFDDEMSGEGHCGMCALLKRAEAAERERDAAIACAETEMLRADLAEEAWNEEDE